MVKRQMCSYDVATVSDGALVVSDAEGDVHFCGPRCLALWAMLHVSHPNVKAAELAMGCTVTLPDGERRRFAGFAEMARWSASNLLGGGERGWAGLGEVEAVRQPSKR